MCHGVVTKLYYPYGSYPFIRYTNTCVMMWSFREHFMQLKGMNDDLTYKVFRHLGTCGHLALSTNDHVL